MNIYIFLMINHLVYCIFLPIKKEFKIVYKIHACTLEFAKEQFTLLLALADIYTCV